MNTVADRELADPALLGSPEDDRDQLDLVRYLRALNRNKWRILLLTAVVGILAAFYASSLPPVYRSTATVLVESSKQKIVSIEEVYSTASATMRRMASRNRVPVSPCASRSSHADP